jgi:NO-binding membrane sensor protein with MHYT domain
MEFLDFSHNAALVIASIVVAFIAGFTGLTLSKDLSKQSVLRRKASIAMSAVALVDAFRGNAWHSDAHPILL